MVKSWTVKSTLATARGPANVDERAGGEMSSRHAMTAASIGSGSCIRTQTSTSGVELPLIAPRPLLVINGDSDDRTPLSGLKECTDAAERAYRDANASDHCVVRIQEKTGHKVTPESQQAAMEWFVRWLIP